MTRFQRLRKPWRKPNCEARWRTVLVIVMIICVAMAWALSGFPA